MVSTSANTAAIKSLLFEAEVIAGYLTQAAKPDSLPLDTAELTRLATQLRCAKEAAVREVKALANTACNACGVLAAICEENNHLQMKKV